VLLIFVWTPPHFWALALFRAGDYARVGVPMLPVVAGEAETKKQILLYSLLLLVVGFGPIATGIGGGAYAVAATILGGGFLWLAWRLYRAGSEGEAKRLFGYSILHLFLLFATLLVEWMLAGGA